MKKICPECGKLRPTQCRGLCWTCSKKPELRSKYPPKTGRDIRTVGESVEWAFRGMGRRSKKGN